MGLTLDGMAPADDDLEWLYGREPRPSAPPEPTQVMRPAPVDTGSPPPGRRHPGDTAEQPRVVTPPPSRSSPASYGPPQQAPVPVLPPPPLGRRRRHPVRRTFSVLAVVLLLFLAGLLAVPAYAWSQVQRVDDAPSGTRPPDQPGTTFLMVGSDSREGLTAAERRKLGTGNSAGQRTDTLMILYIPNSGKPALISVPRDSYVPIPKHGSNKINAAFAFGGPELLVQTVERNTGLRIDAYLEVGFGGFVNVIDAVGGIEMCLPQAIKDRDSHIDLPKGCQTLNGTNALGYVRMRSADPRGDLGRVERQRAMLAAVAEKGLSAGSVLNPVRYWRLSTATARSLKLGQDTSFFNMVSLALAMRKVSGDQGLTLTVPVSNPSASTPAGSAVLWNDDKAEDMFGDIARGDTSKLSKYAQ